MMRDIIFKTNEYVFSYRVAGVLLQNGKVLLQKIENDTGYAIPGGHVFLERQMKKPWYVNLKKK